MNPRIVVSSLFFSVLTCLFSFPATANTSYNLTKGESINVLFEGRSKTLISANERFELGFFNPDGKRNCWFLSIWYYNLRPLTPVWVANPEDPISSRSGGQFNFLPNGFIALRDGRGHKTFFMAGNWSFEDSQMTLTLMDSGNLVLTSNVSGGTPIWQSFENPSDTILPGMKMNGKLKLTAWVPNCEGNTNGNESSSITLEMNNVENDNTLLIRNKSNTIWKSPESFYGSDKLFDPVHELLFNSGGEYSSTRIVMNSTGQIQLWDMTMNSITLVWSAPENDCSKFGFCGKYASCNNENTQSPCRCLPGFKNDEPASSKDCFRPYSQQLCIDDKFAKLKVKKVISPDTPYHQAKDEAACEKECHSNCKCNAYAYAYETSPRLPTDKDEVQGNRCLIWYNDITDMEEDSSSSESGNVIHVRFRAPNHLQCQNQTCGYNLIPYPLSAGANCGDPNYSDFSCNNSTDELKFTLGNLSLPVTRIDGEDRSFDLQITNNATCIYVMDNLQQLPHGNKYRVNPPNSCDSSSSQNSLKIIWDPPLEPICNSGDEDCVDWPNSTCKNHTINYGEKRCFCKPNYKWNGTTLSCTLAGDPSFIKPSKLKMIVLITVVTAGSGILLLALVAFLGYRRTINRRRKRRESDDRIERLYNTEKRVKDLMDTGEFNEEDKKGIDVPFFDLKTILEATNYFSDENKLGQGGFGPVYKGTFPGGQEIAVKRLSSKSVQGLEEFKNEVVLIAKLQHRNLVRLLDFFIFTKILG